MNPTQKNMPFDNENLFDRLVDGELSEADRRSLLASLDAEPAGWRRCALAFLEAQAWRESFGEITRKPSEPLPLPTLAVSPSTRPSRISQKTKRPFGAMGTVMAMAASFLVALGLGGWMLRSPPGGKSVGPQPDLVANNTNSGSRDLTPYPTLTAGGNNTIPQPKASSSTPWQMVQLRAPALTGNNEPLRLPAQPRDRIDEDFLKAVPHPLPEDVRQALERTGHSVRTSRELVPFQLKDGRQLIVPVDQVDVQYDSHQAY